MVVRYGEKRWRLALLEGGGSAVLISGSSQYKPDAETRSDDEE